LERAHLYEKNELCGAAMAAAFGVFPTAVGGRTYYEHLSGTTYSAFKNVPTSNSIDATAEGAITKEVFIAIFDYVARMPSYGTDQDFNRTIRSIRIPSVDMKQLNRFVSVATPFTGTADVSAQATFSPAFQAELERMGMPRSMFGHTFNLISDKTLATGTLYVSFSQAAGTIWEKPGMTTVFNDVDLRNNKGSTSLMKVYQITVEPHQRPNALKVQYIP